MPLLHLAIGLLLSAQAATGTDSWWECYYFLRPAGEGSATRGRLVRSIGLDGSGRAGVYEMWGEGLRVTWRLAETPQGARPRVAYLSMEIPTAFARNGGGIYGYLYGDGQLVATTTMLDERGARRGYAVSTAFFQATAAQDIGVPLGAADRWSLVVAHADGTEILRRDLPLADRRARDENFARHWAALEAAWAARDPDRLITTPADSLPRDRGACLLSTPAARREIEESSIFPTSG
jgi:hypothetical protein